MLSLVVDVLVDLVGHGEGVVAPALLGDRLELGAGEDAAGGIVGRADDDRPRLRAECRGQPVQVQWLVRHHRDEHRPRIAEDRVGPVVLVEWLEYDDFVAGIDNPK